jgi:hypothetical protein
MNFDVFISHTQKDKTFAHALCHYLEKSGIRCWIAPRDIEEGESWPNAIIRGLNECEAMVLIFSASVLTSPEVQREVTNAANFHKVIMPVKIEDVAPDGAFAYYLADRHWLDAITPPVEEHLERLAQRLHKLLANRDVAQAAVSSASVVAPTAPIGPGPTVSAPIAPVVPTSALNAPISTSEPPAPILAEANKERTAAPDVILAAPAPITETPAPGDALLATAAATETPVAPATPAPASSTSEQPAAVPEHPTVQPETPRPSPVDPRANPFAAGGSTSASTSPTAPEVDPLYGRATKHDPVAARLGLQIGCGILAFFGAVTQLGVHPSDGNFAYVFGEELVPVAFFGLAYWLFRKAKRMRL